MAVIAGVHRVLHKLKVVPPFFLLSLLAEAVRLDIHFLEVYISWFFEELPHLLLNAWWSCLVPNDPGLKQISTMRWLLRRTL
jgi:hypothetical protein